MTYLRNQNIYIVVKIQCTVEGSQSLSHLCLYSLFNRKPEYKVKIADLKMNISDAYNGSTVETWIAFS